MWNNLLLLFSAGDVNRKFIVKRKIDLMKAYLSRKVDKRMAFFPPALCPS